MSIFTKFSITGGFTSLPIENGAHGTVGFSSAPVKWHNTFRLRKIQRFRGFLSWLPRPTPACKAVMRNVSRLTIQNGLSIIIVNILFSLRGFIAGGIARQRADNSRQCSTSIALKKKPGYGKPSMSHIGHYNPLVIRQFLLIAKFSLSYAPVSCTLNKASPYFFATLAQAGWHWSYSQVQIVMPRHSFGARGSAHEASHYKLPQDSRPKNSSAKFSSVMKSSSQRLFSSSFLRYWVTYASATHFKLLLIKICFVMQPAFIMKSICSTSLLGSLPCFSFRSFKLRLGTLIKTSGGRQATDIFSGSFLIHLFYSLDT